MTPRGALKSWITEGRTADRPEYLTEEVQFLFTYVKTLIQSSELGDYKEKSTPRRVGSTIMLVQGNCTWI